MWALHRVLDQVPDAAAPYEWIVGRICEEFNCLPSEAVRELETEPQRLVETIMCLRAYSRLKEAVDRRIAGQQVTLEDSPLLQQVLRNVERSALENK